MRGSPVSLLLLRLLLTGVCIDAYKPVIIVHGIFDGPKQFKTLSMYIDKVHPGTQVALIDLYDNLASLKPLWKQVQGFRKAIYPITQKAPDGVHLLCFSQGGLICRALLSTTPDLNVDTFISLSSPLAGQYGAWRQNFLRIKKLVLIGGPDDDVITPWQSSHFGFYDSNENIVEMKNQEFYRNDTFGLKTLDARGDVSGVRSAWSEARYVALQLHSVHELHREVAHNKQPMFEHLLLALLQTGRTDDVSKVTPTTTTTTTSLPLLRCVCVCGDSSSSVPGGDLPKRQNLSPITYLLI
ncbi:Lysosomal thioesterase PPT2 [Larimichthys crocea]|uniref:Uncharacterized protein n=1 Tax=Larimichthys crocea TaxID=215358 RepID=A0ACD3QUX4_LARCR|nr:Lysosomal thioesterase PPT2 [Larimichthys crocea]